MHVYEVNVSQWCFDSPKLVTKKDSSDWSLQFARKNEERKKLDLPHPHPETVGTRIIKIRLYKGISINRAFVTLSAGAQINSADVASGVDEACTCWSVATVLTPCLGMAEKMVDPPCFSV